MSTVQKFVNFTETLDPASMAEVERILAHIMDVMPMDWALSPDQEAEDIRRATDPNPKFATQADVDAVFGRPFPS
jgi:hypothetical protein